MKNYNRVPSIKLNNQAALDYTLYMMTSGCFKKCEINSLILEEQLYHRYRGLRDRKSTRLNSSHPTTSRMPSSA